MKPVKRENSNATNNTQVTGVTTSTAVTAGTHNTNKNNAFYNTQYKTGTTNKGGFFPAGSDNVSIKGNTEKTKTR